MEKPEDDDASGVSLYLQFRVVTCDKCGRSIDPQSEACASCGEPTVPGEVVASFDADPYVEVRTKALQATLMARDRLLTRLSAEATNTRVVISEEDYPDKFAEINSRVETALDAYKDHVNNLDLRTDFLENNGAEVAAALENVELTASDLVAVAEEIRGLESPPGWRQLHRAYSDVVFPLVVEHLKLLDAAVASTLEEAQEALAAFHEKTTEPLDDLEMYRRIVLAGRLLNAGATDFGEVVAGIAAEGVTFDEWSKIGTRYFRDLLQRPSDELPEEAGMLLAATAIHTTSCNDPDQVLKHAGAVASLLRQAGDSDQAACKDAIKGSSRHLLNAADHLMSALRQIEAMDHSRLAHRDEFENGVRIYHRMSEGLFQSLLNLLLFADRLSKGENRTYDEVANWTLRGKVKWKSGGLEKASDPLVASLVANLALFIRNSAAHLSHSYSGKRILIPEKDRHGTVLAVHKYTLDEFATELRRLVEAFTAMAVGAQVFVIERHETYWECLPQDGLGEIRSEIVAMVAAMSGVVVEDLHLTESNALAMVVHGPESGCGLSIQQIVSVARTGWSQYRTVDSVEIAVVGEVGTSSLNLSADLFRKHEEAESSPRLQRLYVSKSLMEAIGSGTSGEVFDNDLGDPDHVFLTNAAKAVSEIYRECETHAPIRTAGSPAWCKLVGRELQTLLTLLREYQVGGVVSPLLQDMVDAVLDLRKFISRKKVSLRKRRASGKAGYLKPLERAGKFVEHVAENLGIGEKSNP